jgi:hypothetical protein
MRELGTFLIMMLSRISPNSLNYRIDNSDALKDLLKSHNISLDTEKAISGQIGQK